MPRQTKTMNKILSFLCCLIIFGCSTQLSIKKDDSVKFFSSDIKNFWQAFDDSSNQNIKKCAEIFDKIYLKNASPGLKDFYEVRLESSDSLCKFVNKYRPYYAETRKMMPNLDDYSEQILSAYKKFKNLYPDASNVEVYYLIGKTTTAGTIKENRLLIGLEMFSSGENTIHKPFVPQHLLPYKFTFKSIPPLVTHELIHTQQKWEGDLDELLELSLNEGSADFLTKQVLGYTANDSLYIYGSKNEKSLKSLFRSKMHTKDVSDFLYNAFSSKNPDLGYFMGYQIVAAYYKKQNDKTAAIKNILYIHDPQKFLDESEYYSK